MFTIRQEKKTEKERANKQIVQQNGGITIVHVDRLVEGVVLVTETTARVFNSVDCC